jgi:hypothetical protein
MPLAARIDEYGRPAWIALMVLGFIIFWPLGLALLAFIIWSGRMGWKSGSCGWHGHHHHHHMGGRGTWWHPQHSSGNRAFDEYREETLKRLEQEQSEFKDFLDRLRFAKDKTEFDQFMAERRNRPAEPKDVTPPQN